MKQKGMNCESDGAFACERNSVKRKESFDQMSEKILIRTYFNNKILKII